MLVPRFGLISKKDGELCRLIHHPTYPYNQSINSFIDIIACTVHDASVGDTPSIISSLGLGILLDKSAIKSAFRLIPVATSEFWAVRFEIPKQNKYYIDKMLPFDTAIGCAV